MPFNQRIGPEILPDPATWTVAGVAARIAFFREAGRRAVSIKRAELARGIGANGRRMARRKHPRRDGAQGPVLTPHDEDSRTSRLLASHAAINALTLFWRAGVSRVQKLPWGQILGFHARGQVRGAPVRDVRLSKRGIGKLKAEMALWWATHHGERIEAETRERIAARIAAEARRSRPVGRALTKAKKAIMAKYQGISKYLKEPKGGGF